MESYTFKLGQVQIFLEISFRLSSQDISDALLHKVHPCIKSGHRNFMLEIFKTHPIQLELCIKYSVSWWVSS